MALELLHGIEVDTEDDELYDEACEEAAELLNSRKVQDKNDVLNIFIKLFGKEMNGQNECADCRYYDECGIKGTRHLKRYFDVVRFPYPKNIKDMGDMTSKEMYKIKNNFNELQEVL